MNGFVSPLASWFADEAALTRFRRQALSRRPVILPPRDRAWRAVVPDFRTAVEMAGAGLPFQVVAERRYDRGSDPRRLRRALAQGRTVFLPQVHQVLPRLMRLMVALRAAVLGPRREECSFLFVVRGTGRPGMGLHHDDAVDSFWLQIEGRRTVTVGPPVPPGTPQDLDDRLAPAGRRRGSRSDVQSGRRGECQGEWWTRDLTPGTLFHLPPRTPHRVVCHGPSLALSLTWTARRGPHGARLPPARSRRDAAALTRWDVVAGYADRVPPPSRDRLWTQAPAVAGPVDPVRRAVPLWTAAGVTVWVPMGDRRLARALARMPSFRRPAGTRVAMASLLAAGVVSTRDLPLRIVPDDPSALDGWRFR